MRRKANGNDGKGSGCRAGKRTGGVPERETARRRGEKEESENGQSAFYYGSCGSGVSVCFSYLPMTGILLAFRDADNVIDVFDAIFTRRGRIGTVLKISIIF